MREISPPTMCHMPGVMCHVSHTVYPLIGVGGGSVISEAYAVELAHCTPPVVLNTYKEPNFKQTKVPQNVWTTRSPPPFYQKMSKPKKKKILKLKHNYILDGFSIRTRRGRHR